MNHFDETAALLALIFVAGDDGISLTDLSDVTGFDRSAVQDLLASSEESMAADVKNPLKLVKNEETYRLITKTDFAPLLSKYYQSPIASSLSKASLEALTIIAYKQPVTRVEVDKIRGVNSSGAISRLLFRDLIQESGRKNEIGRPILYTTTDFFLDYFGLKTLGDLPELPDIQNPKDLDIEDQANLFSQRKSFEEGKNE
ncbi:SMC-Scp complex subunit ScpB [Oenococcus kitaharae]|uniref:Segregation and condensation protein B n=1 Tax=Oenococcus kitaharae DSM 17330 TaxID=1045004 RepID=G9WH36_9LACO|nr:SMC-Scp complex subunit ScpB [Oenococcus kitaharae]EHN59525.1 Segregation and condensation protein B [Oenococcus kitaharae DSM 17330]OEY83380.1 segregation and condensation protein B [Oenococcus kitaharae]OEY85179.1 segregation and condensation protein B [Oenococcus kitaharae]OEY86034.1 segregation and condensation protein B [Oenococcus kitaharae]